MGNKYRNLTKNTAIFAVSSFGTKFLAFLLIPLYTNVLTTKEYGIADVITATSTLLIYIFTINIASAVLRFAIERKKGKENILSYGIRVILVGSIILCCILCIACSIGFKGWESYYFVFTFLSFFSNSLYQVMTNYLRASDRILEVGIAGLISSVCIIVSNLYFLLVAKIGIIGYLISLSIGPLAGALYSIRKARLPVNVYIKCSCNSDMKRQMRAYCIPLIFNDLALWINVFLDKYFVTALCGADQNGIYAVANKIPTILATIYMVFSQAWNISAVQEFDREDTDGFFTNVYSIYNALVVLACSVLIILNKTIAHIMFAKEFYDGWRYSSILLLAIMFNALTSFQGSVFSAVKNTRILARTTLVSAGANICLNSLLIPRCGVTGAAIATAVSYTVMWAIRGYYMNEYIVIHRRYMMDYVMYAFLILQVVIEHVQPRFILGQVIVLLAIIIVYRNDYISLVRHAIMRRNRR